MLDSLVEDARDALGDAGLSAPNWTRAEVRSAGRTRTNVVVGELGGEAETLRFAAVDRSLGYRLTQHGSSWQPGLSGVFLIRLVIDRRYGFQAEILDVDGSSLSGGK
ncbi:MAG: hypothetical protein ACLFRT_09470 [Actinomycetota bacterium]